MKEINDILRAFQEAAAAGIRTALATVVRVEGSSYRRPGARMLVTEAGKLTGAISGGCLEGDALRKALLAMQQGVNKLVVYNSQDEDDRSLGIQLGCNGIVYILFEPIDPAHPQNPIRLLQQAAAADRPAVLITCFRSADTAAVQPGTCITATDEHLSVPESLQPFSRSLQEVTGEVLASGKTRCLVPDAAADAGLKALVQLVTPAVELLVAGAGNDAFPLVHFAAELGWRITVLDGRKTHASRERFPGVHRLLTGKPADVLQQVPLSSRTVAVLMTHNFPYDLAMLRLLLSTPVSYIGVLGPRHKLERMLQDLAAEGFPVTPEMQQRIYGPVGLQIGAETAEEIALSILAEIKAVLSGRQGGHLRSAAGSIHDRVPAEHPANPLS